MYGTLQTIMSSCIVKLDTSFLPDARQSGLHDEHTRLTIDHKCSCHISDSSRDLSSNRALALVLLDDGPELSMMRFRSHPPSSSSDDKQASVAILEVGALL